MRCQDAELGTGAHLRCHGNGRKDRMTPLTTQTAAVLYTWLGERDGTPGDPLFPTRRGGPPNEDEIHQPKGHGRSSWTSTPPAAWGARTFGPSFRNHALVCLSWMGKDFVGRPMISIGVGNSLVPPNRRAGSLRGRDGRLCGRRVLAAAEDAEP